MRFHRKFERFVGGPSPALGSDATPTGPPTVDNDNVLNSRFYGPSDTPLQTIIVAYKGPALAPALACRIFIWEEVTQSWYAVGASKDLQPGETTSFNLFTPTTKIGGEGAGSAEIAVVVSGALGAPAGTYTFALVGDTSTVEDVTIGSITVPATVNQGAPGAFPWLFDLEGWFGSTAPTVGQKTMAASVPVTMASDQPAIAVTGTVTTTPTTPVGAEGNAWAAAVVGANGTSASIDCQFVPFVTAFGNASANTTITLQVSQDNAAFYDAASSKIVGGGGNFAIFVTVGARYVRLKTSAAATITATIASKD